MKYPLVLDLAADGIPVTVTCRVLGFSTQAFNKWRRNPVSQRDWDDAHLMNAALDVHADDPAFGYRFIADELKDAGHVVSERRVWRICSEQGIWSVFSKKRGLNRKAGPPVHDDLVERDFTASAPDQLWLTDITEHRTTEGKLYLCAIKDVYSNRIVGYSIASRMKASLAVASLRNAIRLRRPTGTVTVHSDRGSQFRSKAYVRTLKHNGLTGSMGRCLQVVLHRGAPGQCPPPGQGGVRRASRPPDHRPDRPVSTREHPRHAWGARPRRIRPGAHRR